MLSFKLNCWQVQFIPRAQEWSSKKGGVLWSIFSNRIPDITRGKLRCPTPCKWWGSMLTEERTNNQSGRDSTLREHLHLRGWIWQIRFRFRWSHCSCKPICSVKCLHIQRMFGSTLFTRVQTKSLSKRQQGKLHSKKTSSFTFINFHFSKKQNSTSIQPSHLL